MQCNVMQLWPASPGGPPFPQKHQSLEGGGETPPCMQFNAIEQKEGYVIMGQGGESMMKMEGVLI